MGEVVGAAWAVMAREVAKRAERIVGIFMAVDRKGALLVEGGVNGVGR